MGIAQQCIADACTYTTIVNGFVWERIVLLLCGGVTINAWFFFNEERYDEGDLCTFSELVFLMVC